MIDTPSLVEVYFKGDARTEYGAEWRVGNSRGRVGRLGPFSLAIGAEHGGERNADTDTRRANEPGPARARRCAGAGGWPHPVEVVRLALVKVCDAGLPNGLDADLMRAARGKR